MTESTSTHPSAEELVPAPRKKRRWVKRLGWISLCLLLVLGAIVGLLPTYLSSAGGSEMIVDALREELRLPVEVGGLQLSWSGPQRVKELRVGNPADFAAENDLFRLQSATLDSGILDLVFGGQAISLVIEEPVAHIYRGPDGRFNFDAPLGREADSDDDSEKPRKQKSDSPSDGDSGSLPREIVVSVTDGEFSYEDQLLNTASRLHSVFADVNIKPGKATWNLQAVAVDPKTNAAGGRIRVDGQAENFDSGIGADELTARVQGEAEDFDLRPYRGLLEELAGFTPPDQPIDGEFALRTENGRLDFEADLDAGFARLQGVTMSMPLAISDSEAAVEPLALKVPYSFDIEETIARLPAAREKLQSATVGGKFGGELNVSGPLSLADLMSRGAQTLSELAFDFQINARDFSYVPAPSADAEEDGEKGTDEESDAEKAAETPAFSIVDQDLALSMRFGLGEGLDAVELKSMDLDGLGLKGQLAGVVGATGDGGPGVALRGNLDILVSTVRQYVEASIPEDIVVTPGTRLHFTDLVIESATGDVAVNTQVGLEGAVKYKGYAATELSSRIDWKEKRLLLSKTTIGFDQGKLTSEELIYELSDPPVYKVDLAVEEVKASYEMAPLLSYVLPFLALDNEQKASLSGDLFAHVSFDGQGFSPDELAEHLTGSGKLRVRNGTLSGSRLLQEITEKLGTDFGMLSVAEMGSDFTLAGDGKIDATKVFLQAKDGGKVRDLGLKGSTSFDGRLNYFLDLEALKNSIGDKNISRILGDAQKYLGSDTLPFKLTGTLMDPQVAFDPGGILGSTGAGDGEDKAASILNPEGIQGLIDRFTKDDDDDEDDEEKKRRKREKKRKKKERKKNREKTE